MPSRGEEVCGHTIESRTNNSVMAFFAPELKLGRTSKETGRSGSRARAAEIPPLLPRTSEVLGGVVKGQGSCQVCSQLFMSLPARGGNKVRGEERRGDPPGEGGLRATKARIREQAPWEIRLTSG